MIGPSTRPRNRSRLVHSPPPATWKKVSAHRLLRGDGDDQPDQHDGHDGQGADRHDVEVRDGRWTVAAGPGGGVAPVSAAGRPGGPGGRCRVPGRSRCRSRGPPFVDPPTAESPSTGPPHGCRRHRRWPRRRCGHRTPPADPWPHGSPVAYQRPRWTASVDGARRAGRPRSTEGRGGPGRRAARPRASACRPARRAPASARPRRGSCPRKAAPMPRSAAPSRRVMTANDASTCQ